MSSPTFLVIDEKPVSFDQVLNYLQVAGKFPSFLLEILYQHAINQELQSQTSLSAEAIEQVLIDFRIQQELTDPEEFQAWLNAQGINYEILRQQLAQNLALEQLKTQISQSKLQDYFSDRKLFLDQVILSWVVTDTQEAAKELFHRLEAGATFEQVTDQAEIEELMSWGEVPEALRSAINSTKSGKLIAPLEIDQDWYIVRVDDFLPAELNADLEAQLRTELFEQWLMEKVGAMNVKL